MLGNPMDMTAADMAALRADGALVPSEGVLVLFQADIERSNDALRSVAEGMVALADRLLGEEPEPVKVSQVDPKLPAGGQLGRLAETVQATGYYIAQLTRTLARLQQL